MNKAKCTGAHCRCMDIGGQCPNTHWYHCKECNPDAYAKGGIKLMPNQNNQVDWKERLKSELWYLFQKCRAYERHTKDCICMSGEDRTLVNFIEQTIHQEVEKGKLVSILL